MKCEQHLQVATQTQGQEKDNFAFFLPAYPYSC